MTIFICLGFPKCATSTLYDLFRSDQQVCCPVKSEKKIIKDREYITKNNEFKLFVDVGFGYVYDQENISMIVQNYRVELENNLIKFIVCIRNPQERYVSKCNYLMSFKKKICSDDIFREGMYFRHLSPWVKEFGLNNFYFIHTESFELDYNSLSKEYGFRKIPHNKKIMSNASRNRGWVSRFIANYYISKIIPRKFRRILDELSSSEGRNSDHVKLCEDFFLKCDLEKMRDDMIEFINYDKKAIGYLYDLNKLFEKYRNRSV